jgi:hypothetical protein
MGYVLNKHPDSRQTPSEAALLYRLQVPGAFGPIEFGAASEALSFAKMAFPMLAGQGLRARVWIGKRVGECEIWPITPRVISV